MKAKMPLRVTLKGTEDIVVIGDTWNTIKNWGFGVALIALVFLFCMYGFPALLVVLSIAAAIFGGWMIYEQKAPLGKIGACAVLLVVIVGLLVGAWMFQKPNPSAAVRGALGAVLPAVPASAPAVASSPQQAPAPTPTTTVVTAPALPQVVVNFPFPDHLKLEVVEEKTQQQQPVDPTVGMTPEERRQYEIWVLRK
ncbi:MAG: hypothetical protein UU54_C0011G0006 [Candidatus Yanofskybacteria bacterium GW2011_GWA2_41_22]|uniref:Uncharacterized protein n=3 Tax=Candidatus Yanofskyibacteriota TaxID=1752733 RepID=A0A0G0VND5_9BACT|nr:MAG: hypothetical protein UU54_C0011G0006 [Candidatus Yanofskybacteria bacterium GW2011_GWA2_41_22]KKS26001.1 MAG: hypothetical protein UU84_C0029G0003 [Candidatus Yanofskybacteria bacterium GW2011_GWC2_41_9]OGM99460.1 MAG: hypothetical protein A2736_01440 [Candidatus Yanofskybacteria bacterium RIFCSPHIGHO2_01_FULL_41_27]OGN20169.1 MAG: hypothetical protein A3B00_02505 [Candidatus Yanofskybacteria bacterium RIFCSPLOWO2_01_FULL_41_33]